jgi:hypothetical protein
MSNPSGPDQDATPAAEETDPGQKPTEEAPLPADASQATEEAPLPADAGRPTEEVRATSAEQAESSVEPAEAAEDTEESSDVPTVVIPPEPQFESAEPTEELPFSDDPALTQRRYSAPSGFDVKSTEIIHVATQPSAEAISAPTEAISAPTAGPDSPEQVAAAAVSAQKPAAPRAIPPRPRRYRSWGLVLALILVIAALAAVLVLGTVWLTHKGSPTLTPEDHVRQTILDFDAAIQRGDLAQLRDITCGTTHDGYVNYPDKDWNTTHARVAAAKQYPVVASIDQVAVNGQHGEANVTTFMAYAPQVRSTRSFDLQFVDGRWKICQGPIS